MAIVKKKRQTKKRKAEHHTELNGLLVILIAIIGLGDYGYIGRLINNGDIFLVGSFYKYLLILLLIMGFYMVIK